MPEINEIDFEDAGYETELARDYAKKVAREAGERGEYSLLRGSEATYVETRGIIFWPHDLAVKSCGTSVKYNRELVSDKDILDSISSALKPNQIGNEEISQLLDE